MKHAVSRELYSYWDLLRKGRSAPERSDIDPAAIRGALSDTFIAAADGDLSRSAFAIRLSGTRLNALFLDDLKGVSLLSLWERSDQVAVAKLFQTVLDDAIPVVAGLRGAPADHRPIDLEMVLLPLRHRGRTHARMMGAIAPIEMPSWLGLLAIERLALTSLRLIDPDRPEDHLRGMRSVAQDEAEDEAGEPRRYGRFIVHQGGR